MNMNHQSWPVAHKGEDCIGALVGAFWASLARQQPDQRFLLKHAQKYVEHLPADAEVADDLYCGSYLTACSSSG